MKRLSLLVALIIIVTVSLSEARIKTKGRGEKMNFDADSIQESFKPTFNLMSVKCIKCHTMERVVIAVQTGRAPITGQPFNKQAVKAYGIKMLRKPNSDMDKKEIRDIVVFLNYVLDENQK
ncbi:MAG TPA: cytochrome C [Desulfuromonadales bacterium]|nr:cytochrome C [Desulfuromonadales bacterium]